MSEEIPWEEILPEEELKRMPKAKRELYRRVIEKVKEKGFPSPDELKRWPREEREVVEELIERLADYHASRMSETAAGGGEASPAEAAGPEERPAAGPKPVRGAAAAREPAPPTPPPPRAPPRPSVEEEAEALAAIVARRTGKPVEAVREVLREVLSEDDEVAEALRSISALRDAALGIQGGEVTRRVVDFKSARILGKLMDKYERKLEKEGDVDLKDLMRLAILKMLVDDGSREELLLRLLERSEKETLKTVELVLKMHEEQRKSTETLANAIREMADRFTQTLERLEERFREREEHLERALLELEKKRLEEKVNEYKQLVEEVRKAMAEESKRQIEMMKMEMTWKERLREAEERRSLRDVIISEARETFRELRQIARELREDFRAALEESIKQAKLKEAKVPEVTSEEKMKIIEALKSKAGAELKEVKEGEGGGSE